MLQKAPKLIVHFYFALSGPQMIGVRLGADAGWRAQRCSVLLALKHLGAPTLASKYRHSHTNGLMDTHTHTHTHTRTHSGVPCLFILLHMALEQSSVMANGLSPCARQVKQQHAMFYMPALEPVKEKSYAVSLLTPLVSR